MLEIDKFARALLEEAKRFLEKASDKESPAGSDAYLHGAVMLAFCALEAHVNAVAEEVASRSEVSTHEKGFLLEKEVRLENGEFRITNVLKMARLEDRIKLLHAKFGRPFNHSDKHWPQLADALIIRNRLSHPKDAIRLTESEVGRAITAIVDTIDALYRAVYNRKFPAASRGLKSKLEF
jgi:hypothetical protein